MRDQDLEAMAALTPAVLRALDGLEVIGRYLTRENAAHVVAATERPHEALRPLLAAMTPWEGALAPIGEALGQAGSAAMAAYEAMEDAGGDIRGFYRALRYGPMAQEALYPLTASLEPVSRWFLPPERRDDEDLVRRLAQPVSPADFGFGHLDNEAGQRGGVSVYVPETYDPAVPAPLVMALHGGAGHGRSFLWSWVRDARAAGAIVAAPTARGETWALSGADVDTPNLVQMLAGIRGRWNVDPARMLLTGMSDGGTFSYVSGLEPGSPFTHLAPVSAAFHPMLASMADRERIRALPIHIVHGALDWMFPVSMAREAAAALEAAGAAVRYREIADLAHTYPREANAGILQWLGA